MKTFSKSSTIIFLVLAVSGLIASTGCSTKDFKPSKVFSLDNAWPFDDGEEEEPELGIPMRIVGAWTDTVMTKPGQKAQRGFGGRLIFYGEDNEKPILVDGQLVVYAFDEAGRAPTDNRPTRRYVFPPEQMKQHMSKNDLGASYSFWLPWDEAGGAKAEVSLICRFEPKGGAVVTGEQTRHVLPGSMPMETAAAPGAGLRVPEGVPMRPAQMTLEKYQAQQQLPGSVQAASYNAPVHPPAAAAGVTNAVATAPGRQMAVTSIALPNNFQMPEGTTAQPISPAAGQAVRPGQVPQTAPPALYQQPQFQQPAVALQPGMQPAQPPVMNGAARMQSMPVGPGQLQPPNGMLPRAVISPISTPGIYVPQNIAAPISTPQYVGQAPPMMPQQQIGMMTRQPLVAVPAQPMATIPAQQVAPQQSYQQPPNANGLRTAVSYGPPSSPATIPWR